MGRGLPGRCPACGKGRIFNGFLRVVPECEHCDAPLGLARADDAPPYFTILIVGHIVIPAMLIMQKHDDPPTWLLSAIFLPLTLVLSLGLLRPIKGATVGAHAELQHAEVRRRDPDEPPPPGIADGRWPAWCWTARSAQRCRRHSRPTAPRRSPTWSPRRTSSCR